jgi:AcrR family transcriptional regulator
VAAPVNPPPARRRYSSPQRAEGAAATRHQVLTAAGELFTGQGYAATSVAQVAARAGVAVDTVYASVGRKPALIRALVEAALSGTDDAVPGNQREYAQRIRATSGAREKLAVYAAAVAAIGARLAPVHRALAEAAVGDADCAALRRQVSERRAANMLVLAQDLRATGEVRPDLSDREVADVLWSTNSPEHHQLLVVERGWTSARFQEWLADSWSRSLLRDGGRLS